jgi:16S rRNA processing protein RimM
MTNENEYVIVGKIGATFGIKGWLKIISYTENSEDILDYDAWYLEDGKSWKRIQHTDGQLHGKGVIVHLEGYNTPEISRLLTGKNIAVLRSQLPKLTKNEYYWRDLEGLTVINEEGLELGKIIYLMATGANDVLVVKGTREHAIPFRLNDTVVSIDLDKKVMHVKWEPL